MNTATVTIASANTGSGRRAMGDAKDTRNDQESTAEDKEDKGFFMLYGQNCKQMIL